MQNGIEVKNLSKYFDEFCAVNRLSFSVKKGEVLGFLGPNGAGKSTTMKMITGYLPPSEGTIKISDYDIVEAPLEAKKLIGYLPEGAPAYTDMTPSSYLSFIANIRGYKGSESKQHIERVVNQVHLEDVFYKPIETLSKGFKRRVGLAQALLHNPDILILDEPTDGLDPNQKYEVRHLINEMAEDKTIIISTHILEEVEAICTRSLIISHGKIIADGSPTDLLQKSSSYNSIIVSFRGKEITKSWIKDTCKSMTGLAEVDHIDVIDSSDNYQKIRIYADNNKTIIEDISKFLRKQKWPTEEIYIESGRLDEVFRNITKAA